MTLGWNARQEHVNRVAASGGPCRSRPARTQIDRIESAVASSFSVRVRKLHGASRRTAVVRARQVVIYLLHTHLGLTFTVAATCLNRDRTTAAYACRSVESRREDEDFDMLVGGLERSLELLPDSAASKQKGEWR